MIKDFKNQVNEIETLTQLVNMYNVLLVASCYKFVNDEEYNEIGVIIEKKAESFGLSIIDLAVVNIDIMQARYDAVKEVVAELDDKLNN